MKALFAKLNDENDFIVETGKQFKINSKKKIIRVAADGEIYKMKTPLTYEILQSSVELIVPEK
jgi:diacylglycerol kinase family enzyme